MPKIPESEWGKFIDPESEDYSPSETDIKEEDTAIGAILDDLSFLESEIGKKDYDYFSEKEDKFSAEDPINFWDQLYGLKKSLSEEKIIPQDKIEIEEKISEVEKKVCRQYIPFIDSKINIYGWEHSPFENHPTGSIIHISSHELQSYFKDAYEIPDHYGLPENEKEDYFIEIDRLAEKFERYKSEPLIFSFEDKEEDIQRKISFFASQYENNYYPYRDINGNPFDAESTKSGHSFDDSYLRHTQTKEINDILGSAQVLFEIAGQMKIDENRTKYTGRAESLKNYLESKKDRIDLPSQTSVLEARLKSLLNEIRAGQITDDGTLADFQKQIGILKEKPRHMNLDPVIHRLQTLLNKAIRLNRGEYVDDDEERFTGLEPGSADWAWEIFGLERGASFEDISREYRRLARKYHPDVTVSKDTLRLMQDINEAFDFLRRYFQTSSE